jgi:hypothetical protein
LGLDRHVEHTKATLGPCWVNTIHNIQPIDHTCYDNGGLTWRSCPTHYNSMMGLLGQCKWTCEHAKRMLGHIGLFFFGNDAKTTTRMESQVVLKVHSHLVLMTLVLNPLTLN